MSNEIDTMFAKVVTGSEEDEASMQRHHGLFARLCPIARRMKLAFEDNAGKFASISLDTLVSTENRRIAFPA